MVLVHVVYCRTEQPDRTEQNEVYHRPQELFMSWITSSLGILYDVTNTFWICMNGAMLPYTNTTIQSHIPESTHVFRSPLRIYWILSIRLTVRLTVTAQFFNGCHFESQTKLAIFKQICWHTRGHTMGIYVFLGKDPNKYSQKAFAILLPDTWNTQFKTIDDHICVLQKCAWIYNENCLATKYMTSHVSRPLCNGPDAPTEIWKCYWLTD